MGVIVKSMVALAGLVSGGALLTKPMVNVSSASATKYILNSFHGDVIQFPKAKPVKLTAVILISLSA
jgi:hypothetical protein